MTRGIVYVAWGDKWLHEACRSSASARKLGYETALLTDDTRDWSEHFTIQKQLDFSVMAGFESFQVKWLALLHSPFDVTCFLDSDTTVHGSLDLGFELAEQGHFCVTISPAMVFHHEGKEWIHYNGGTFYFKGHQPELFRWFCEAAKKIRGSGLLTDEPPMSLAFRWHGVNPMVLPPMFNCIRVGRIHTRPIKVFHSRFHPATEIVSDHFGNEFVR